MEKTKKDDAKTCGTEGCCKCMHGKILVLGILVLLNSVYGWFNWAAFVAIILIIKGLIGLVMPHCPHCK